MKQTIISDFLLPDDSIHIGKSKIYFGDTYSSALKQLEWYKQQYHIEKESFSLIALEGMNIISSNDTVYLHFDGSGDNNNKVFGKIYFAPHFSEYFANEVDEWTTLGFEKVFHLAEDSLVKNMKDSMKKDENFCFKNGGTFATNKFSYVISAGKSTYALTGENHPEKYWTHIILQPKQFVAE